MPAGYGTYDRHKYSKDKEKFLREFESEIIVLEAAARRIKNFQMHQFFVEKVKVKLYGLTICKTVLQMGHRKI